MNMYKVGERVLYRNPDNLLIAHIGTIESVNLSGTVPYGVKFLNRPYRGKTVKSNGGSLSSTSAQFAKILVVGNSTVAYECLAQDSAFSTVKNDPDTLYRGCDLVMFTGGEDVNPVMYGHTRHKKTACINPRRDAREALIYHEAKRLGIPCVGICRGAQFLNVMNGGAMIQHVTNHLKAHDIVTECGHEFLVTSTHHQMMDPTDEGEVIGWAKKLSTEYAYTGDDFRPVMVEDEPVEPEIVIYRKTGDLCVQYHPEIMGQADPARLFYNELLKELR